MPPKRNPVVIKHGRSENRRTQEMCQTEKFQHLLEFLDRVKDQNFTGYIKINFTQGSIGRIEKFEEILKY